MTEDEKSALPLLPRSEQAPERRSGVAKVLFLVEDDANDQELARIALESSNVPHQLTIVSDGVEALGRLLGGPKAPGDAPLVLPAVVLLDLKLPKLTGLEVLAELRRSPATRLLPVVVFTSSVEERDVTASYSLGANAYVRKPNDFSDYAEVMEAFARFWCVHNEAPPRAEPRGP